MAWKTFVLHEPHQSPNGLGTPAKPLEDQLSQIEANGYEIRFVFKESSQYTVLTKRSYQQERARLLGKIDDIV